MIDAHADGGGRHRVVLASAGTGKTFRLTSRFLALLADGVDPASVLATTFTRKAAGEIAQRVLQRLARAIQDPAERATLSAAVAAERRGEGLDQAACRALLTRTVRQLHRLDVLTLDAFFVKLGVLFGLDLGLPSGWAVAEQVDDARLRDEAVARVLERASTDRLVKLLAALDLGDPGRSARLGLLRAVSAGYDVFLETVPAAWRVIQPEGRLGEEQLAAAVADLEAMAVAPTKAGTPNKVWDKARNTLVGDARRGDWKALLKRELVGRALRGEETFSGAPIEDAHRAILAPLGRHAGGELVAAVAARADAMVDLLGEFDRAYRELKAERRLYRFEDLPRRLRQAGPGAEELAFRLGDGIEHLLLDEFQDTSVSQWGVLKSLVESVLDPERSGRSFFCVGDVKQSIYAWRSGEPRLLAELAGRYGLEQDSLRESYRSAPVILDTVNQVFARVAELPVFQDDEALAAGARRWQDRFEPQTAASTAMPGSARVFRILPDEHADPDGDGCAFDAAVADHVAQLARARPTQSVGVLYRTNASIPGLMHALKQRGLHASGEGGSPLTDSDAVLAALSALQLADHPGDRAALFHVATSPLGAHVGLAPADLPPKRGLRPAVSQWAAALRLRLVEEGYGAVLASFRPAFAASGSWDVRRFAQLVDLAYATEPRATLRPSDFVEIVRGTAVEDPTSSQVKVMTIHASKGLEFDVVVMPELCAARRGGPDGLLVHRPDPWQPVEAVFPSVSRDVAATHEPLRRMLSAQRAADLEEKLCNLYVGMTRAIRRLDLILQGAAPRYSFGKLIETALAVPAGGSGEVWRHEQSSADEALARGDVVARVERDRSAGAVLALPAAVGRRPLRRRPSEHAFEDAVVRDVDRHAGRHTDRDASPKAGRATSARDGRLRGLAVHRWLEELAWHRAGASAAGGAGRPPFGPELARGALGDDSVSVGHETLAAWHAELVTALDEPALREVFDPSVVTVGPEGACPPPTAFEDGSLEVLRERAFLLREQDAGGQACVIRGICDRVVIHRQEPGGAVLAVDVIDHKTDRVDDEAALRARVELYGPQVGTYVRAVAAVLGMDAELVRGRLLFVQPFGPGTARVVDLPHAAPVRR